MRLILDPRRKKDTILGWEWLEPVSYGYDKEGWLASILCKAGCEDGSVDLAEIREPELSEDLMMNYIVRMAQSVSTSDEIGFVSADVSPSEMLEALQEVTWAIDDYCNDWNEPNPTDVTVLLPKLQSLVYRATKEGSMSEEELKASDIV